MNEASTKKEINVFIGMLKHAPDGSELAKRIGQGFYVYPDRHPPPKDGEHVNTKLIMAVAGDKARFWATMEMFE